LSKLLVVLSSSIFSHCTSVSIEGTMSQQNMLPSLTTTYIFAAVTQVQPLSCRCSIQGFKSKLLLQERAVTISQSLEALDLIELLQVAILADHADYVQRRRVQQGGQARPSSAISLRFRILFPFDERDAVLGLENSRRAWPKAQMTGFSWTPCGLPANTARQSC
jgi:hypothetical protein